jgi:hypothetical protein
MQFDFPEGPPGFHPPTSVLEKILRFTGVVNPVTEQPFSEALLLGIGGGLDAGYILFKFEHLPHPILTLGFRHLWNNTKAFMTNLNDRLLLASEVKEFENEKEAEKDLQENIKDEKVSIVWVDKASLPHHHLPENLKGFSTYQVGVYARDGRLWRLYLDDSSSKAVEIREKTFTAARTKLAQNNFLIMVYDHPNQITAKELRETIIQGISDCAAQLTHPNKNIGVSNWNTWAEQLINHQDKLGWPNIFQNQEDLFKILSSCYELIKLNGTEGFALRKMYADFLQEAAVILKNPSLNAIAGQYLQLANHWSSLAENALPSNIAVFDRVKSLINKKYLAFRQNDMRRFKKSIIDLQSLEAKIINRFPMDLAETNMLFEKLASRVKLISELEASAAFRLRDIARR